nr:unnamed protein product [Callosobruchus analis]
MVLLAVVDARYQFIMCDFGVNGRISDGGVLQILHSMKSFMEYLEQDALLKMRSEFWLLDSEYIKLKLIENRNVLTQW